MSRQMTGARIPQLELTDITGTTRHLPDSSGSKYTVLVLLRGLW